MVCKTYFALSSASSVAAQQFLSIAKNTYKKLKKNFYIEEIIAKENNKLECHYNKWEAFLSFIEDAQRLLENN